MTECRTAHARVIAPCRWIADVDFKVRCWLRSSAHDLPRRLAAACRVQAAARHPTLAGLTCRRTHCAALDRPTRAGRVATTVSCCLRLCGRSVRGLSIKPRDWALRSRASTGSPMTHRSRRRLRRSGAAALWSAKLVPYVSVCTVRSRRAHTSDTSASSATQSLLLGVTTNHSGGHPVPLRTAALVVITRSARELKSA